MTGKLHSAPHSREQVGPTADDGAPVILHPLVVLNVSDHFTRFSALHKFPAHPPAATVGAAIAAGASSSAAAGASSAAHAPSHAGGSSADTEQENGAAGTPPVDSAGNPRVLGILLGTSRGRTVEVCHSFELPATGAGSDGRIEVNQTFMTTRLEQYRQIFAQYNVVGWYCTGVELGDEEHRLHTEVFSVLNEAPILLFLSPVACKPGSAERKAGRASDMIVALQMETKVVNDEPRSVLSPVAHRYASEDSERIAVDHVMRHAGTGGADGGTSSTTLHLGTLRRSISMLQTRLKVLVAFLEATVSQKIPVDHALLRQVAGVCARLPALDCAEFSEAFADEKNDSQVVTYLSGVTKSLCSLSEAVDMFNRFNTRSGTTSTARRRSPFMRI